MNKILDRLKKYNATSDKQLLILSIVVAIFMWTYVTTSTNPSTNRTFRNVPIIIQNQDKLEDRGYTIVSKDDISSVNVRLTGSRDNIVSLKADDIQASINVMAASEGINSLDVKVDTPSGIYLDNVDPAKINLNIQRILEKSIPVNIVIDDKLKDGKIVEVNEQNPKVIKIKGPESVINQVDRVEAHIDDAEYLDGKIHNVAIKVLDKKGQIVEGADLDSKDVNLSFIVYETKKVKVNFKVRGDVANGYIETLRAVSPDTIVIKGPGQIIRDIDEISTKTLIAGYIRSSKSGEIKLDLPEGVEVYDGDDTVTYKIEIQRIPVANKDENGTD
ncbi:CdaR family protein [uncultured Anaerococcus sp.]|uniref:CdaR family protein n=1 Tax=uncultured Anaerococcus sp. TaxID=293428 RepID=UPI00288ADEA0|nr:CdaR family protein [uncultured Anaerococcus sp.]